MYYTSVYLFEGIIKNTSKEWSPKFLIVLMRYFKHVFLFFSRIRICIHASNFHANLLLLHYIEDVVGVEENSNSRHGLTIWHTSSHQLQETNNQIKIFFSNTRAQLAIHWCIPYSPYKLIIIFIFLYYYFICIHGIITASYIKKTPCISLCFVNPTFFFNYSILQVPLLWLEAFY